MVERGENARSERDYAVEAAGRFNGIG